MSNGQRTGDVDGPYGPYRVQKPMVRAPGAWLVEGRTESDERCILQLARCKPASDPEAKRDRDEYVQMIEAATKHLSADADIKLLGHGTTEEPDGSLMLYWALPWVEGADQLGRAKVDSIEALIAAATVLLERMEQRHNRGRLAPILTEQVLVPLTERGFPQVGLPIHLPPGWLTADVPSPRLAPEERDRAEPRLSGDVWRVGRTLRALSAHLTNWPQELKAVIDKLDAESLSERFGNARMALIEVEALQSTNASSVASIEEPPLPETSKPPDRGETQIAGGPPGLPGLRRLNASPSGKDGATVRVELSDEERQTLFGEDDVNTDLPTPPRRKVEASSEPSAPH
ncbi:MAG: hypothetical protein AAFV29_20105, partial [Myxococcota bacterium]